MKSNRDFLINNNYIKAHPTKKYITFVDGDYTNWNIENLLWTNTTEHMAGCLGMNLDAADGAYNDRIKAYYKATNEKIASGFFVPVIREGEYDLTSKKQLPDTSSVNVDKLLGRRFR